MEDEKVEGKHPNEFPSKPESQFNASIFNN